VSWQALLICGDGAVVFAFTNMECDGLATKMGLLQEVTDLRYRLPRQRLFHV
jgi:hypothetical protein